MLYSSVVPSENGDTVFFPLWKYQRNGNGRGWIDPRHQDTLGCADDTHRAEEHSGSHESACNIKIVTCMSGEKVHVMRRGTDVSRRNLICRTVFLVEHGKLLSDYFLRAGKMHYGLACVQRQVDE